MNRAAQPRIAVLIACHNRRDTTLACLTALRRQTASAHLHPMIFDDGSSDGTAEAVRAVIPDATIMRGDGSAYWSGAMRRLFDSAIAGDFDHCLWLNDDVTLHPDAVARLLATSAQLDTSRPMIVGGAVADPTTGAFTYGGIDRRHAAFAPLRFKAVAPFADAIRRCDTLHGNVVLVPIATARAIGSIGTAFVHTLGDLDYGLRVARQGGVVALAPGFVGTCAGNPGADRWFQADTTLADKWRLLRHPRGFPIRPWLAFARRHGGLLWAIHAAAPFWRLFVPRLSRGSGPTRALSDAHAH